MSDMRNASLVLKTSDQFISNRKQRVDINSNGTVCTWYDINLRTLLGDMYDDYDLFNLCLNTVNFSYTAASCFAGNEDRCLTINVSGLPFINQTYDQATGNNGNSTCMGAIGMVTNNTNCFNFYSNNIATFGKNQDVCNITISLIRALDGKFANNSLPLLPFPNVVFLFDIVGVVNDNLTRNKPPQLKSFGH